METLQQDGVATRQVREVMTTRPATIQEGEDLSRARELMLNGRVRHLPVLRGDEVEGMISDRDILGAASVRGFRAAREMRVAEAMNINVPAVSPFDSIQDVASKMVALRVDGMPVVERGTLVGVVTATDLLFEMSTGTETRTPAGRVTARDLMTPDPESTSADVTVLSAASKMSELDIRHLPVVDRENRLVGMLSDRDVREAIGDPATAIGENSLDDGLLVSEAMRESPVRIGLDAGLEQIANVFTDERVGAIVVVDEGNRPVGILSYVDVIAWFMRNREVTRSTPTEE